MRYLKEIVMKVVDLSTELNSIALLRLFICNILFFLVER